MTVRLSVPRRSWLVAAALAVAIALVGSAHAAKPKAASNKPTTAAKEPVGIRLQRASVNIRCETSLGGVQGSGSLITVEIDGKKTTWVLTAHHVVEDLRHVRTVIGPKGDERKQVYYDDAEIVQEQVENGRVVGEIKFSAKVVNVDPRRDIALLRVRKDDLGPSVRSVTFYLDDQIPVPGTPVLHCGAPGGSSIGGSCSLTHGIVSRIGVTIKEFGGSEHGVFDQVDCPALGGSSGGMVVLQSDGRWIGMLTLGLRGADNFHWIVPIRSVRQWAKEVGVEWLLDPKAPRPTQADLDKIPLELDPAGYSSRAAEKPTKPAQAGRAVLSPSIHVEP